ncbi:MAG: glutamate synthase subunit beta [Ruminobacter sp.]|nr:glutamate synthase subunit beta [Ruminobacter sp.]MDY5779482.1 glutamate synthase subunit beta [Succinivibrionaceae bacterium]
MGKPTGFLEYDRIEETHLSVEERIKNYNEFTPTLTDEQATIQAARCMDCGIPFCSNACPVHNVIPDFNDLVYHGDYEKAIRVLHSASNFPEFTGRVCPALCEASCSCRLNGKSVGIRSIERKIIDRAWDHGLVKPQIAKVKTGKTVAIVGSGPSGLACAQQLARAGHKVTVYEKNSHIGGLLRFGIPDFKLPKSLIDRRIDQMEAEGISFMTNTLVADTKDLPHGVRNDATKVVSPKELYEKYDAIVMCGGSETPRDLKVPGRELKNVHFALEYLIGQNKEVNGGKKNPINTKGKHVIVIGGGDTGADCVGTANRQGAASITQIELFPRPPLESEIDILTQWPEWPRIFRTYTSHEEGCERLYSLDTTELVGENGAVKKIKLIGIEIKDGRPVHVPGTEQELPADFVFIATGFLHPLDAVLDSFGVERDQRGNVKANPDSSVKNAFKTSVDKVFAAGDMRSGQSLVVRAMSEGRRCAHAVDEYLMGVSLLPVC